MFSAEWLFDAYLRADACALEPTQHPGGRAGWMVLRTNSSYANSPLVLGHGKPCFAVLLSDDCEIETCITRRKGTGRLVLAALDDPSPNATLAPTYRRYALEPSPPAFAGGVIRLDQTFAVRAGDLASKAQRIWQLADRERAALERQWVAYVARRGPRAAEERTTKLGMAVAAAGDPLVMEALQSGTRHLDPSAQEAIDLVRDVVVAAWRLEGEDLRGVSDYVEDVAERRASHDGRTEIDAVKERLRRLSDLASAAADALDEA